MATNGDAACIVSPVPVSLQHLSDADLLDGVRGLVGRSNRLLAELLAHLGEVEARGIHRLRACSSLYTYCIHELRLSEDEAFRRVTASRLVRRFPALFDALASGELHLTGLLMLGPHLTQENVVEVLARAKYRTKRELGALVRLLDPLPAVPTRIEPLGPVSKVAVPKAPTWEEFVGAFAPVRELAPGERPRDWVRGANDDGHDASGHGGGHRGDALRSAERPASHDDSAPARELHEPQLYKVQFTATEEYVRLVEEAKALLSHALPNATLDEIQLRALQTFVAGLKKRKYATTTSSTPLAADLRAPALGSAKPEPKPPRQRGRHIPAPVRRAVAERDGVRCTYVDVTGRRCSETHRLEFHHLKPFARGGEHAPENVTLRCSAHNSLAAEDDFGAELVAAKKDAAPHDPFRRAQSELGGLSPPRRPRPDTRPR
jgi:hypothetical protein